MREPVIIRFDSKGRLLIPFHIREFLSLEKGGKAVIVPNGEGTEAKIVPVKDKKD